MPWKGVRVVRIVGPRKCPRKSPGFTGSDILPSETHLRRRHPMYVVDFLRTRHVGFEAFFHSPASSASRLAGRIRTPGRSVAKPVLIKAGEEFVLAVLAATSRVDLDRLGAALRAAPGSLRLATPGEVSGIFNDCEPGAIPAFG